MGERLTHGATPAPAAGGEPGAREADALPVVLECRGLSIRFGGLVALSDFNLTLRQGELVGLIGPNGAGKTTVFNLITGIYRPTAGDIRLFDRSIVGLRPHRITQLGVARTFQNIRLFGNMTVLDNVRTAFHSRTRTGVIPAILRTRGFHAEEQAVTRRALELLETLRLSHRAEELARNLPYGEQRRLEIARALATGPRVLLLDEPAAGMNPSESRELRDLIEEVHRRFGLTTLLIEHHMDVVMSVCQRVVVLDYGRTIAVGTPDQVRRNPAVIAAYLGEEAG
ncbi:amino acid/amide ABC transporter ATP-binding protein 1, HAAT family [Thermaerobacter marianensis DSM 12885]|uniref:Amino acid/amide ABC transporter ATP-binding protein 1, HAAT family n=1 Tax=Thermaerobacter marianensis (strain ATCC 700841 / DSM 12885 / JCM 10246 / 7p75a) TaxID=644966 RepID=E6SLX8_THEM7|nr:amino acid/amide ABC transporter ATP-binding protein 1, HAAT family [Thermaerobacter marianensis DSM 12885]